MSNYPSKDTLKTEVTMEHVEERNCTPEKKAIYQKIKEYVLDKYGLKVYFLYIAQIKDKRGLNKEHIRKN